MMGAEPGRPNELSPTGLAVAYSGTDVTRAMEGTDTVFVVAPAFATADFARLAAPYLRAEMVVAVCPGSCVGSLVFKEAAGLDVHDESVIIGETNTLPGPGAQNLRMTRAQTA